MGFSSGTFTFTSNTFAPTPVTGTTISSTDAISTWSEIATGLSTCLLKDGSQTATSSVPFVVGIAVTTGITTPSTTFALVNTTATTINFGGACTTLNVGTGTFTLATAATTANVFNTTATTVNAFGAATTLGIGANTGTTTPKGSWFPQNSQSAAYTTVAADANKHILHPAADNSARTFTIDSNANVPYPVGTTISFFNQINTVTISITDDTLTLYPNGTTGNRTLAANGMAVATKLASTSWAITGVGLS